MAEARTSSAKRLFGALAAMTLLICILPSGASAAFGLKNGSPHSVVAGEGTDAFTQAGGHPGALSNRFELRTVANPVPGEEHNLPISSESPLRNATVEAPPGLVGDPTAVPHCTLAELVADGSGSPVTECPDSSQVGVAVTEMNLQGQHTLVRSALYNLVPEPGQPALFGMKVTIVPVILVPRLRSESDYGIDVTATNIDQSVPVTGSEVTFWGVPASPEHDGERGNLLSHVCADGSPGPPCSSDAPENPFLRLPSDCAPTSLPFGFEVESWSGKTDSEGTLAEDPQGHTVQAEHCERVPFEPTIEGGTTTDAAGTASGLDFTMKVPEAGIKNAEGIGQADLKKAVVTLPEGVTLNPSSGEGLGTCSLAQYGAEALKTLPGAACPNASKLGTVAIESPLLAKGEVVSGSLFLAQPNDPSTPEAENPFNSLLALYMVARLPERGVIIKAAGKVDLDPQTGQITTTFDDLPQLPFTEFHLHLREGARAPLVSASSCGPKLTKATLTPWSAASPTEAAEVDSSLLIAHGVGGGACPTGGLPPFRPGLIAGSLNNAAGRFSPFSLRLFRSDEEQEITHFSIKLPPGVSGKLAGIPFCSDGALALAKSRERIGGGKEEQLAPACPPASQVGRTLVGAGVGSILTYIPGKVYLAGPYHGSSLSIAAITSGVVGPFDIGTVVVREALRVNPETGEVFIDATGSDPIPHITDGIATHIRDLRAYVERPQFTLNPTDCSPTSTASTVLGAGLDFVSEADDRPITVTSPFQAADCAALPFKPKLSLKLLGGTKRGQFPRLKALLRMNGIGEAGIASAQVTLPKSEFIANAHFDTICTRVQFKQAGGNGEACPAGSVYGWARAKTPLLTEPLEGPIYLRSSEHQLPDVVASLRGSEINVHLVGHVDSVKGRLRNTFEAVPDAPVDWASFSFAGGKKGLFENSTNLCRGTHKASVAFAGQNGKEHDFNPAVKAKCGSKAKQRRR